MVFKNDTELSVKNWLRASNLFAPRGLPFRRQEARPKGNLTAQPNRGVKVQVRMFSQVACPPSTPVGVGCSSKDKVNLVELCVLLSHIKWDRTRK